MATIIWCDRVRHVVQESRSQVDELIARGMAASGTDATNGLCMTSPFVYFTIAEDRDGGSQQRALNVNLVSSFEALPSDPV